MSNKSIDEEKVQRTESESLESIADASTEEGKLLDKALMKKIDLRILPFCSLLYLLSFLDRTAIGNGKLYGLLASLNMNDTQYLISLTVFFFTYAALEIPSNILLKRLRPSIWIPSIMVAWGLIMLFTGFVTEFNGLWITRLLLGAAEAGLFPGINYFLSSWYKRSEFGLRAAIFFSAATVSGAFGGLLAAGIGSGITASVGALTGSWRWIFIIEGIATVVVGLIAFFVMTDFPSDAKFLNEDERKMTIDRLLADDHYDADGSDGHSYAGVHAAIADWKMVSLQMIMYMSPDGALYSFALFTPSIINGLGYSGTVANLLSVPIYVYACILTVGVGYYLDRQPIKNRTKMGTILLSISAAGYIMLITSRNHALSYFAIYVAATGIFPNIPLVISVVSQNCEGSLKRGVVLAAVISWGNLNGAVSSNIYRANQKPWYSLGHGIVLIYILIGIIANLLYRYIIIRENAARYRGERDEAIGGEPLAAGEMRDGKGGANGWYPTIQAAKIAKGDRFSQFRYSL